MNKSSSIRNERQLTAWEEARVLAVELATILSRPEITSLGLGEVAVTIEPTSGSTNTVFFSPRELLVGKELLKVVAKFEKRRQRAENTGRDNDLEFEQALDRCDKALEKMTRCRLIRLQGYATRRGRWHLMRELLTSSDSISLSAWFGASSETC